MRGAKPVSESAFSEILNSGFDEGIGGFGAVTLTGAVGGGLNYELNKFSKKNLEQELIWACVFLLT